MIVIVSMLARRCAPAALRARTRAEGGVGVTPRPRLRAGMAGSARAALRALPRAEGGVGVKSRPCLRARVACRLREGGFRQTDIRLPHSQAKSARAVAKTRETPRVRAQKLAERGKERGTQNIMLVREQH